MAPATTPETWNCGAFWLVALLKLVMLSALLKLSVAATRSTPVGAASVSRPKSRR